MPSPALPATPRKCPFPGCEAEFDGLAEFARHTDGHALQMWKRNQELEHVVAQVQAQSTGGIGPGRYFTANGQLACVAFRCEPRAGAPYWSGMLEQGGPCAWDDEGKDLRGGGYEEWDLRERVDA